MVSSAVGLLFLVSVAALALALLLPVPIGDPAPNVTVQNRHHGTVLLSYRSADGATPHGPVPIPLSVAASGVLSDALGARGVFLLGGALLVAAGCYALSQRPFRTIG